MDDYFLEKNQHLGEMDEFVKLLLSNSVISYLEIGSKYGGSLWRVGNALPLGSQLVAVDMPFGDGSTLPHLQSCVKDLREKGQQVALVIGDSTDQRVIDEVQTYAPFDCVLIDANHTLPYVTKDWENYGPMSRMVVFHDIGWGQADIDRVLSKGSKFPIEVATLWNRIKKQYKHVEIRMSVQGNGFGVLWR